MKAIDKYRERHRIDPTYIGIVRPARDGFDRWWQCGHDGIRIVAKRGGGWRHDPGEVKAAAKGTA